MKKIAFIILGLSMTLLINYGYAQKPYYYYFDKVIELTENPTIRYIDFIDETTAERDSILRDRIRKFATEIPYGNNKYMYVTKDTAMMDSVLKITGEFQDIISLNSMQYLLDSLTILVPQRMVFVKTKKDDFPMKEMLDSHNISYSNIKKRRICRKLL